ncbi:MAG TPA: TIGR02530 family flagellar biosynthesis protein [Acidobacteriota bacterium]|nr:TIGR02530 family flagellar biosynthesis protein [Acidobacteriota bacterium]
MNGMRISNYQRPVDLLEIAQRGPQPQPAEAPDGGSFKEMFSRELADSRSVQFSKHASQRLFSRNIELSAEQLNRIADAIDRAAHKHSKETLILTEEAALVVSVANRTVITAFDRENLRSGVVTSIDSAVIL